MAAQTWPVKAPPASAHTSCAPTRCALVEHSDRFGQIDIRREYHDVDRPLRLDMALQLGEQHLIGGLRPVHFPIARDHRTTHSQPSGMPCRKGGED